MRSHGSARNVGFICGSKNLGIEAFWDFRRAAEGMDMKRCVTVLMQGRYTRSLSVSVNARYLMYISLPLFPFCL